MRRGAQRCFVRRVTQARHRRAVRARVAPRRRCNHAHESRGPWLARRSRAIIGALVQSSVPPSGSALLPTGVVVGKGYRILNPLAEGGMGVVYEAEQLATGAKRALKVM